MELDMDGLAPDDGPLPCGKLASISQADVNEHLKITSTSTLQSQFVWLESDILKISPVF